MNIEIKNLPGESGFDPEDLVAREVADLVVAAGRQSTVIISSFWPDTLEAVRLAQADLATGLLISSWFDPVGGRRHGNRPRLAALHPHRSTWWAWPWWTGRTRSDCPSPPGR